MPRFIKTFFPEFKKFSGEEVILGESSGILIVSSAEKSFKKSS